jgi:hypothetical protein
MVYKTFKENGWLVGSEAIEASHRYAVQQSMKLSRQGWTISDVQQLVKLRVAHKSNQLRSILKLITFKKAA